MLKILNVTKVFKTLKLKIKAVSNISLDINEGDFIVFTGPSGSGKTTLLSIIGGLIKPTLGDVVYRRYHLSRISDEEKEKFFISKIGFIFQVARIIEHFTVLENIVIPTMFHPEIDRKEAKDFAVDTLQKFDFKASHNIYPKNLSGGEIQKMVITRALITKPEILIADEPTGDLDFRTCKKIGKIFQRVNRAGCTIVMATHSSELASIARTIYIMKNGRIEKLKRQSSKLRI